MALLSLLCWLCLIKLMMMMMMMSFYKVDGNVSPSAAGLRCAYTGFLQVSEKHLTKKKKKKYSPPGLNLQFIQSWFYSIHFHILLNYSTLRVTTPKLQKHTFSHLVMQIISVLFFAKFFLISAADRHERQRRQ